MANKADTEFEDLTENDDVCCGLILRQIEFEWTHCHFCGSELPEWAQGWSEASFRAGE